MAAKNVLTDSQKRSAYDASLMPASAFRPTQRTALSQPLQRRLPSVSHPSVSAPTSKPNGQRVASAETNTCPTCNSPCQPAHPFCLVCGSELNQQKAAGSAVYSGQVAHAVQTQTKTPGIGAFALSVFRLLGWRKVRGTIVTAEAPYGVDNEFILWRFLLKIGVFIFLAMVIYDWVSKNMLAVFLGGAVILLLAIFASGIFCLILGQLMGGLFSAKLFGKEKQIQVRDVRLRDTQLQEHVVRFRGELRAGQVAVGDEIEIWGKNRGGTVMARWGYNFRTRTRISVKYR